MSFAADPLKICVFKTPAVGVWMCASETPSMGPLHSIPLSFGVLYKMCISHYHMNACIKIKEERVGGQVGD